VRKGFGFVLRANLLQTLSQHLALKSCSEKELTSGSGMEMCELSKSVHFNALPTYNSTYNLTMKEFIKTKKEVSN
jgi:hypothetical protein